jgi:hypothetical protein
MCLDRIVCSGLLPSVLFNSRESSIIMFPVAGLPGQRIEMIENRKNRNAPHIIYVRRRIAIGRCALLGYRSASSNVRMWVRFGGDKAHSLSSLHLCVIDPHSDVWREREELEMERTCSGIQLD